MRSARFSKTCRLSEVYGSTQSRFYTPRSITMRIQYSEKLSFSRFPGVLKRNAEIKTYPRANPCRITHERVSYAATTVSGRIKSLDHKGVVWYSPTMNGEKNRIVFIGVKVRFVSDDSCRTCKPRPANTADKIQ